ncbi:class I SAM-dependent methyltransferase [Flaviaesturariibacter amylovorans]|uniref:Methyltransferase domain-containing protein n=1 Tax=Flaviaesturariibacter amylovorans TaxID=1084520 RepID=A0ABP8GDP9_9BACT
MDKKYWEEYYSTHRQVNEPSLFARFVAENYAGEGEKDLIELGCGDGRDAIYFNKQGLNVTAVDQASGQIEYLEDKFKDQSGINFVCGDFTQLGTEHTYDLVYSRFTLHSITESEQARVLNWAYNQLNKGGLFCIEVRGKKNELYQKGTQVAGDPDAYIYDDHYRRFLDFEGLCAQLKGLQFSVEFAQEADGFAPFKDTNETFIRVVSRK